MAPFLRMQGITKRFPGVVANRDVDLEVDRGEIRGLLGENGAGKSTLVKILYGLFHPDEGTIEIDGKPVRIRSPRHAVDLGIGMVHQHFMLVPTMTVAENVALGLRENHSPFSRLPAVARRVRELSQRYGLDVDPDDLVEDLSVGLQQRVEILKLLYRGAELLVLDEPTAVLTPQEWHELAQTLRDLADHGKAVIFISHKLDEQLEASDWCTVLRDGAVVGTVHTDDVDKADLARMMVGRDVVLRVARESLPPGEPVIEVSSLRLESKDGRTVLDDVSFEIREREILGVAGIDGNGQRELVEVIAGVHQPSSGTIRVCGRDEPRLTPQRFHRHGGAIIPEDRHRTGVALDLTITDNLMLKDFRRLPFARRGITAVSPIREHCEHLVAEFDVRTPGTSVIMRQLSGGNQQRSVVARELCGEPTLLIAAQPTRGLDVGAMEFVYDRLLDHRKRGGATLLVSTELDEILSLSDRIAVIVGGRFVRILDPDDADDETLGLLMGGAEIAPG
ncbi:MAG: ABC transporter ATP-binding protein [Acidimicrobiia bacterium]|nr:ABC transporter ATP-binding protein [Acidimicrobiia bacterium]